MGEQLRFAVAGNVFVRDAPERKGKRIQQLLWGDEIRLLDAPPSGDWLQVIGRREKGWLHKDEVSEERLLEINFVDVGQGDGAFLVTPDNQLALVDAGASSNMRRFLSWRFNLRLDRPLLAAATTPGTVNFEFALISHGDKDHFGGFKYLFESQHLQFKRIYHNTLVERKAASDADELGARGKIGGVTCYLDLIESGDQLTALLAQHPDSQKTYLNLLGTAAQRFGPDSVRGITSEQRYLEGFDEQHQTLGGKPLSIEVLGPVPLAGDGQRGLPKLGSDTGISKNGHSVVLLLRYGSLRFLLGGDLNVPAELHLLRQKTQREAPAASDAAAQWDAYLQEARRHFGADIAKSCHHGSADFSTTFLRAIDATATVISSGDEEPYCHPRPETLGALGRYGRGERPCIFSTELMRSSPEFKSFNLRSSEQVKALIAELETASDQRKPQIAREIDSLLSAKERIVATYGMITLRSDGERVLIAQKLERPGGAGVEFDMHWFSRKDGVLTLDDQG
ncbi:ComEC/Rec2 family competence protein [Pseudomonas japonica]|uniref:ComEC/Rec2 family competence protein n=1 Tax=Pseudomonas japonica TaxID=256466 RepID=UPI00382243EE